MLRVLAVFTMVVCPVTAYAAEYELLFDGKSLEGWQKAGGGASYTVEDGTIVGRTGPGKNTFLTRGPYADFVLEFDVQCDAGLNSGVQIRSHLYEKPTPQESQPKRVREAGEMYGYQCEIRADLNGENGCAGNFWDEGRRTRWLDTTVAGKEKQSAYKPGEWNSFVIVAQGQRIRSFVNGVPVADFTDDRDASGLIGLQVHAVRAGANYTVKWKNIRLRKLADGEVPNLPEPPAAKKD